MYKALKNLTNGGELILADTEDLTSEQLGGDESVERYLRLGAIEEMTAKKSKAVKDATGDKAAVETKEK